MLSIQRDDKGMPIQRTLVGTLDSYLCSTLQKQAKRGVKRKLIKITKKKGSELIADLGTKHVSASVMHQHLKTLNFQFRDGQAEKSLEAAL